MLSSFTPLVSDWFTAAFGEPTQPQLLGWPEIRQGRDVLISAPTGSGKTLAAFLSAIDLLAARAQSGALPEQTEVLYVSPLKALSNDVHKNLDIPLAGIAALAAERGVPLAPIRTALRTGDTPQWERQQLTRNHPHILVTTPESLYILLTAARPREMLRHVRTVIVDEIHAIADDKRGSHLALSLARLDRLVEQSGGARPQRIGLSATVKPIEEVAAYLSDSARIVNIGHRRAMDLGIEIPQDELGAVASNEMWGEIYDRTAALIRENRTTLVFVNTRRLSERVTHHLAERLGEDAVLPHHGSLSRALRLEAERRLKSGELRAVVATASLELGIDIGSVDLVCQIGSPRSIAVALQRIGRAGHWVGALPKGRLFATTREVAFFRASLLGRVEYINDPLVRYRRHGGNLSRWANEEDRSFANYLNLGNRIARDFLNLCRSFVQDLKRFIELRPDQADQAQQAIADLRDQIAFFDMRRRVTGGERLHTRELAELLRLSRRFPANWIVATAGLGVSPGLVRSIRRLLGRDQ